MIKPNTVLNLVILTGSMGYRHKLTDCTVTFHYETVQNDILEMAMTTVVFDTFTIPYDDLTKLLVDTDIVLRHLQQVVKEFILEGDKPPLTGQKVFIRGSHAIRTFMKQMAVLSPGRYDFAAKGL